MAGQTFHPLLIPIYRILEVPRGPASPQPRNGRERSSNANYTMNFPDERPESRRDGRGET